VLAIFQGGVPKWLRERSAKPRCSGSNPLAASNPLFRSFLPDPQIELESSRSWLHRFDASQQAIQLPGGVEPAGIVVAADGIAVDQYLRHRSAPR
jgi:hypothetical protein